VIQVRILSYLLAWYALVAIAYIEQWDGGEQERVVEEYLC
jgi:hypothetical protein